MYVYIYNGLSYIYIYIYISIFYLFIFIFINNQYRRSPNLLKKCLHEIYFVSAFPFSSFFCSSFFKNSASAVVIAGVVS